jgi:cell shape-determining protein MreD
MSIRGAQLGWMRPGQGNGMRYVAAIGLVAVLLQVTIIPRFDIGPFAATPNLVVATVVAVAALRGVVVGATFGFATGLLVELLSPGDTLGVLAIAYVAIGAWCGRFASGGEPIPRVMAVLLVVAASALVPVWLAVVELLRGDGPPVGYVLGHLVLPQIVLAPLMAVPAWWAARRLLGAPRDVEPWTVPT